MTWRALAAELAAALHTPLPEVRRLPAAEALEWHREAARIEAARAGSAGLR